MKFQDIKQTITLKGYDLPIQNDAPTPKEINFDYWTSERNNRNGSPITRELAKELIEKRYWIENLTRMTDQAEQAKFRKQPKAITFDRELLMLLLSQKGCEGIRCYFASNPSDASKEELTLVLVGVDENKNDLKCVEPSVERPKKKSIVYTDNSHKFLQNNDEDTIIIEVGGHDGMDDFD
jgi:hypothetical protein